MRCRVEKNPCERKAFVCTPRDADDLKVAGGVHVGVSGFSYPKWKGRFYPEDTKPDQFLAYYSTRLDSVEINSSFYAAPSAAMVKSWSGRTGEAFKFSFKAPKQITHVLKLSSASFDGVERLSRTLDLLGPRRGPILFQLPPFSRQDLKLLEAFLSGTAEVRDRVFEFRHESWFEDATYELLERHGAGFCVAESEEVTTPVKVTGRIAYFRLRNEAYEPKAIDQWAAKIRKAAKNAEECYVYLRHDETGENAVLAQRLSESLA
jgi:uncharacterized protein YecE (DUF72 family)